MLESGKGNVTVFLNLARCMFLHTSERSLPPRTILWKMVHGDPVPLPLSSLCLDDCSVESCPSRWTWRYLSRAVLKAMASRVSQCGQEHMPSRCGSHEAPWFNVEPFPGGAPIKPLVQTKIPCPQTPSWFHWSQI